MYADKMESTEGLQIFLVQINLHQRCFFLNQFLKINFEKHLAMQARKGLCIIEVKTCILTIKTV